MNMKRYGAVLLMALGLTACGGASVGKTETQFDVSAEQSTAAKKENTREAVPSQTASEGEKDLEARGTREYVGLKGHIKEVRSDMALIRSDADEFPGAFWVTEAEKIAVPEELKGGTSVFVLMEDIKERESDGLEKFRGIQLFVLPQDQETGKADVFLTEAPPLILTDALSSRYEPFEIRSGNYTWDTGGGAVIACGAAPLEEAAADRGARLKLPRYQKMDQVLYTINTVIAPDILVISQWDVSQLGGEDAEEESRTTYYGTVPGLVLEKDKVYGIEARWKKEKLEKNGFWGTAGYVLVTE
ncbi:MAG: hypothetical protein HFG75_03045 [Hungatella sp.]|nr:hypothetical protein [Hungatella sp.]